MHLASGQRSKKRPPGATCGLCCGRPYGTANNSTKSIKPQGSLAKLPCGFWLADDQAAAAFGGFRTGFAALHKDGKGDEGKSVQDAPISTIVLHFLLEIGDNYHYNDEERQDASAQTTAEAGKTMCRRCGECGRE